MNKSELHTYLNDLYAAAKYPPLRQISDAAEGRISYTSAHNAIFIEPAGCRWRTIEILVQLLDGDLDHAKRLWQQGRLQRNTRRDVSLEATSQAAIEPVLDAITALQDKVDALQRDTTAIRAYVMGDRTAAM